MTPHNDSKSHTRLELRSKQVLFRSRVQCLSLLEEAPGLDLNGDGLLTLKECQAGDEAILEILTQGYLFGVPARACEGAQILSLEFLPRTFDGFGMPLLQELNVVWEAVLPGDLPGEGPLVLVNALFLTTSPGHQDRLIYSFDSQATRVQIYTAGGAAHGLVNDHARPAGSGPAWVQTVWQGGAGLALALMLCLWWSEQVHRMGFRRLVLGWASFVFPGAGVSWWLHQESVPTPGAVWLLPLGTIYLLADRRLGGGLLRSSFALMVLGAGFAAGAFCLSPVEPELGGLSAAGRMVVAASLCLVLAALIRPFWRRLSPVWGVGVVWIGAAAVFLIRLQGTLG